MNYRMKVVITNPETKQGMTSGIFFDLSCNFAYDENQYGNGHFLCIKGKEFYAQHFDLRYDMSFDRNNKEKWLSDWAKNYWSGKDGAWAIESLVITKE